MKLTLRLIEIESETIEPAALRALLNLPDPAIALPEPPAIAAPAMDATPAIAATPAGPARRVPRRPQRPLNGTRPKPKAPSAPPKAAKGETMDPILRLLAKGPLTSGELLAQSKLTPPSVYSALSNLRASGLIETRDDEGVRKNFLK